MSTAPSPTSMCDQKSPNARVRQTVRMTSPNCRPRPALTQPCSDEYDRNASDNELTCETRIGVAFISDLPVYAPPSVHAHQRRPSKGALTMPTSTRSSTCLLYTS